MIFEGDEVKIKESSSKIMGDLEGKVVASNNMGHVKIELTNRYGRCITGWLDEDHFEKKED